MPAFAGMSGKECARAAGVSPVADCIAGHFTPGMIEPGRILAGLLVPLLLADGPNARSGA
jgi:hypothetical protein